MASAWRSRATHFCATRASALAPAARMSPRYGGRHGEVSPVAGMPGEVFVLDKTLARLGRSDAIYQGHCQTVASNAYEIERAVIDADLVIGAVLIPGAKAPSWSATSSSPG